VCTIVKVDVDVDETAGKGEEDPDQGAQARPS
jgi:hypothetical protein